MSKFCLCIFHFKQVIYNKKMSKKKDLYVLIVEFCLKKGVQL